MDVGAAFLLGIFIIPLALMIIYLTILHFLCKLGKHKFAIQYRKGYKDSSSSWNVVERVKQTRKACKHCFYSEEEWVEHYLCGLQGLSMSSDRWDKLREEGYLWNEQGFE